MNPTASRGQLSAKRGHTPASAEFLPAQLAAQIDLAAEILHFLPDLAYHLHLTGAASPGKREEAILGKS